jgi:hypothetical protein
VGGSTAQVAGTGGNTTTSGTGNGGGSSVAGTGGGPATLPASVVVHLYRSRASAAPSG